jgi:molecular chaperone IbpA
MNIHGLAPSRRTPTFDPALPPVDSPIVDLPGGTYPPYNIERFDADLYRIVLGVAGYSENEVEVREEGNDLIVRGETRALLSNAETIRRLIEPKFERRFRLLNGFRLDDWQFRNGLLLVDVARDPTQPALSRMPPRQVSAAEVAMAALAAA